MEIRRDVFQAIADPTRRAILALVAVQAMTPNGLAAHFEHSRQAISKHVKVLVECNLVCRELTGREIYYHLNPEKMREIADWLKPFYKLWDARFTNLEQLLQTININNHENH